MYRMTDVGDPFHDVVDVWTTEWDDEANTVRPAAMADATLDADEAYPHKRIVAHFLQPHFPFLGDSAEAVGAHAGNELAYDAAKGRTASRDRPTVWELLGDGAVDVDDVRRAYDENLRLVLPHVRDLVDSLDGKTVVTSDHGNLVGERIAPFGSRRYGHPIDTYADELRRVPWFVVEGETRKDIRAEQSRDTVAADADVVTERLAHLGYDEA
jgi:hypothetical protein